MTCRSFLIAALVRVCLFLITFSTMQSVLASPLSSCQPVVVMRQTVQPYFPDTPVSCPICAKGYPSINSCAQAAPVLANFTAVIFNPGAFFDVIKCSCTDTFQSVFPQCADCFERTNQTAILDTPNLPSLVNSIREVCASASSLLGNVSNTDGETTLSPTGFAAGTASTPAASAASGPSNTAPPRSSTLSSVITGAAALTILLGVLLL
ncbi:hypothetical protein BJV78DRAFT_113620 [Lactifluus subvellereus]|nr:hypothetical protein BJV78DRAFT_113620 [Lactifluus subvellereus]